MIPIFPMLIRLALKTLVVQSCSRVVVLAWEKFKPLIKAQKKSANDE